MPHVHYGSTSRPGISSPERSPCQPRLRQTRRSLPSSSCPFTGPVTSQLAFCTRVRHAMPPRLPSRQCPVNKQIGARTMVPEAALTYSHGDPLPTRLHPMNDSSSQMQAEVYLCPAANHTGCLLLFPFLAVRSGSPRHTD